MNFIDRGNKGFGLLTMIVALGIAGLLATFIHRAIAGALVTQRKVTEKYDLEQIRNYIRIRTSCAETAGHASNQATNNWREGLEIGLYAKNGSVVIGPSSTLLRQYQLKAETGQRRGTIKVFWKRNGRPYLPLFRVIPFTCPAGRF